MPTAALRACRCGKLTAGPCQTCTRQRDRRRPTAHARGYTLKDWRPFRRRFLQALVDAGIQPICGASLPTGPRPDASQCHAAGLLTFTSADGSSLHFDHEPALEDYERTDTTKVCDPNRIGLLCQACHAAKSAREARGGIKVFHEPEP